MGIVDVFSKEDRIEVKFSDFYELVKGCTQRDMLMNVVKTRTPYEHILAVTTGEKPAAETPEEK